MRGYQPTLSEFKDILELAQRGIDAANATAELRYRRGRDVTTSDENIDKVQDEDLSKLIKESGVSKYLVNLTFISGQKDPSRDVRIFISPDGWTYYTVQSSDFTWALGRFHELTEALLNSRKLPAKARFPLPEIFSSRRYRGWGAALWNVELDWRIKLARMFGAIPIVVPLFIAEVILLFQPHISSGTIAFLAGIGCAYAAIAIGYLRWLTTACRSRISILECPQHFFSLIIGKNADPGYRAMFIVTAAGVVVAIIAFIFGRP